MDDKTRALSALRAIFDGWKELTGRLLEPEATVALADGLSVKEVVGHLYAWQLLSIARLEAARAGGEPALPDWVAGGDPDSEADLEAYNARIRAQYGRRPWDETRRAWRDGFLRLLALAEAIPAEDLTDRGRYPWLNGYAPIDVLWGTHGHHQEHLEGLV
jgi:hypothetical protein